MKEKPCSQCNAAEHCGSMKFIACKNKNWKFYTSVIKIKGSASTPNSMECHRGTHWEANIK